MDIYIYMYIYICIYKLRGCLGVFKASPAQIALAATLGAAALAVAALVGAGCARRRERTTGAAGGRSILSSTT